MAVAAGNEAAVVAEMPPDVAGDVAEEDDDADGEQRPDRPVEIEPREDDEQDERGGDEQIAAHVCELPQRQVDGEQRHAQPEMNQRGHEGALHAQEVQDRLG